MEIPAIKDSLEIEIMDFDRVANYNLIGPNKRKSLPFTAFR